MSATLIDAEAEAALIGAVLIRPDNFALLQAVIADKDFAIEVHQRAWRAFTALRSRGSAIDHITVIEQCIALKEPIAPAELMKLDEHVPSAHNAMHYAEIVLERSVRRQLRKAALDVAGAAESLDRPLGDTLTRGVGRLVEITGRQAHQKTLGDVSRAEMSVLAKNQEVGTPPLLPTGIAALDRAVGGLPPMLTIIGGRPGAGKSAVVATIVRNVARSGKKIGIFSLEDRANWLTYRFLSSRTGISNSTLRFRRLTDREYESVGDAFSSMAGWEENVLVDDRSGLGPADIVQRSRHMVLNQGAEAIVVDHLGEVRPGDRRDRHDLEIAEVLGHLRNLSKDHGVPVIVCAHLSRKAEDDDRPPRMSDFKNAGAIEEMARLALALTRDEDTIHFHVLKNTNGKAHFRVDAEFVGSSAMIASVEKPTQDAMGF